MLNRLTNRQVRALIYGVTMILIALQPSMIGVGLFFVLMDTVEGQRG